MTSLMSRWCSYFTTFFSVSIVEFEQVNVSWVHSFLEQKMTSE